MARIKKPMRKKALSSSIGYKKKLMNDGFGSAFDDEIIIKNVGLDVSAQSQSTKKDDAGFEEKGNGLIFVDYIHSSSYPEFNQGDIVIINNIEFKIVSIERFNSSDNRPVHQELTYA